MGNVPIPFSGLTLKAWSLKKKLMIWKTISLSSCIVGTAVYMSPLEPYIEAPAFGILVPTFIIGYIIVASSDIFMLLLKEEFIFLELCISVIGVAGSLTCGIYQLYKWIKWIVNTSNDPDQDYGVPDFVLAAALLLHSISLTVTMVHRLLQMYNELKNQQ